MPATADEINGLIGLYRQGRLQDVVEQASQLASRHPDDPVILNVLGIACTGLGRPEEAVAHYTRALHLNPEMAEVHCNLGAALIDLERHEEAVASCTAAVKLRPAFAEARYNLGNALRGIGRTADAAASFRRALQLKPGYAAAHINLGITLGALGRYDEAVGSLMDALPFAPDSRNVWYNLSIALGKASFATYSAQVEAAFRGLLEQDAAVRPSQVAKPIIAFLKRHPSIDAALRLLAAGRVRGAAHDLCAELSAVPLFLAIIALSPIPDLEVERLLTELRAALLLGEPADRAGVLAFQIALALHCFTNEYVFAESSEETEAVERLEAETEKALADGRPVDAYMLCCVASYRPLHRYAWALRLSPPGQLSAVWKRQVGDVLEEASIRRTIGSLKPIVDETSSAVRSQYEENPYPRWIKTQLAPSMTVARAVKRLGLKAEGGSQGFPARPDILIAGCGTGQQAVDIAFYFADSKVLAVDLSLGSLSYAVRRTREMGISNIEYLQADILDLGHLQRQFDIVVSTGVLHHMADPMAGWRSLVGCVKPGGLMNIALYSELARKSVVEARKRIAAMNLKSSLEDIRRFRNLIVRGEDRGLRHVAEWDDFYATSPCRDLLFHVQEHRLTIPEIKEAIATLGLSFAGFVFSGKSATEVLKDYGRDSDVCSLDVWQAFETEHPATFSGMYQFWVQKPDR